MIQRKIDRANEVNLQTVTVTVMADYLDFRQGSDLLVLDIDQAIELQALLNEVIVVKPRFKDSE